MIHLAAFHPPLAQATPPAPVPEAAGTVANRVSYGLARLQSFDDPRLPILLIAVVALAIAAVVWAIYRRDAGELPLPARLAAIMLRCLALVGLLVFYLGLERRTTTEVIHNSQVTLLVDVSQSMALGDTAEAATGGAKTRAQTVVDAIAGSPLVEDLRRTHDVNIARFGESVDPVVTLPKIGRVGTAHQPSSPPRPDDTAAPQEPPAIDWSAALEPRATQTRLGEALAEQLRLYRDAPLAGVVVITDGAQNSGIDPAAAVEAAKAAKVPLYSVGVGSTEALRNIAVRDLVVPARAFPGDTLNVTAYLQADGYPGRSVEVELLRRSADESGGGTLVDSQHVALGEKGQMAPVSFDLEPGEVGTFVYQLRVKTPPDDGNPRDNQREAEVVVVDRQTRVLLFASGPMRDYQFLRNQLHRDKTMIVDVLLQTARTGISQDANQILQRFPTTAEELYQYDCIVAFDPDWTELQADQIELLEKWVSEEAGGIIAVAGPIHTAKWTRSTEHAALRDLYPVVFQQRLTLLDDGQYGGETPWPLAFERAGREAKALWLANTAEESEAAWDSFPGVYGYYAVKGEKPGATVYARFSDPEAGLAAQRPVYMASQFYGAGQVFYIGSGEMWRLRGLDPSYFEVLYTKLIRNASQGRILRGSSRGSLLVERDRYELGETIVLRARLADEQYKPLTLDSVAGQVLRPDGTAEPVKLTAEIDRPGMYAGQVKALQEGTYQVSLALPGIQDEPLSRYLQVRVPDLERTHAERNEPLLAQLAKETGGIYYKRLSDAVHGSSGQKPLSQTIESRAEVKLIRGAADENFARAQMQWLLGLIAGSLFIEWIVRRLHRLA